MPATSHEVADLTAGERLVRLETQQTNTDKTLERIEVALTNGFAEVRTNSNELREEVKADLRHQTTTLITGAFLVVTAASLGVSILNYFFPRSPKNAFVSAQRQTHTANQPPVE